MLRLGAVAALLAAVAAKGTLRSTNVNSLCADGADQEAGYFDIDAKTNKHYFYWSAGSRSNPATDPIIVWMTGGPGCSSMLALSTENGPCLVNKDGSGLDVNPYGWNANATAIWVDQPAGVGFSYGDVSGYDSNEAGVAKDMLAFLQAWFAAHPALANNQLYIMAESYGGHYAPAVSHAIFLNNQNPAPGTIKLNLAGVGIGNGLTSPLHQYSSYPTFAYNYTGSVLGQPVIDLATYEGMESALQTCIPLIAACQNDTRKCAEAQNYCDNAEMGPYEQTGLNPYNFKIPCQVPGLCYDETPSTTFWNAASTKAALGVASDITWASCNYAVNSAFASDWMKDFDDFIAVQLEAGIRVVVYSGDLDFIVNWLGGQAWTLDMAWSGQAKFNAAAFRDWKALDGSAAALGQVRTYGPLSFIRVFEAGHMVPMDKPASASQLLLQFTRNQPF